MATSRTPGIITPETSSGEGLDEDQPSRGVEGKRKKFHPLRAVRKIFRWRVKRPGAEEVVEPSKKSRSTGELQSVPDDERRLKVPAVPYSIGLSVSHDSVFSPDPSSAVGDSDELRQGSSLSVNRTSHKMFRDELFTRVQARRDSDDDDIGLPHSPCTSPTTVDVLNQGLQAKSSKPQSTCSAGSLSSMFSSENDEDSVGQIQYDLRGGDKDGDPEDNQSLPLSHKAAHHKISVKPKRTHALPRHRRLQLLSNTVSGNLPTTPEVSEDANKSLPPSVNTPVALDPTPDQGPANGAFHHPPLPPKPSPVKDQVQPDAGQQPQANNLIEYDDNTVEEILVPAQSKEPDADDHAYEEIDVSETNSLPSIESTFQFPSISVFRDDELSSLGCMKKLEKPEPKPERSPEKPEASVKPTDLPSIVPDDDDVPPPIPLHKKKLVDPQPQKTEQSQDNRTDEAKPLETHFFQNAGSEEIIVDVRESVMSIEISNSGMEIKKKEEKMASKEKDESQRTLDELNGNILPDKPASFRANKAQENKITIEHTTKSSMVNGSGPVSITSEPTSLIYKEGPKSLVSSSPPKFNGTDMKVDSEPVSLPYNGTRSSELSRSPASTENEIKTSKLPERTRKDSSESSHSVPVSQRSVSVDILPFSQRRRESKDSSYSVSPTKAEIETKDFEKKDLSLQNTEANGDHLNSQENKVNYPVHFRVYKGRKRSVDSEEKRLSGSDSTPESTPNKEPLVIGQLQSKSSNKVASSQSSEVKSNSSARQWEIKIQQKPEESPNKSSESSEPVELRHNNNNKDVAKRFGKERSKSVSEVFNSPSKVILPSKEESKHHPFSRSVYSPKLDNGEPELFKVFARRSLKQKNPDKKQDNTKPSDEKEMKESENDSVPKTNDSKSSDIKEVGDKTEKPKNSTVIHISETNSSPRTETVSSSPPKTVTVSITKEETSPQSPFKRHQTNRTRFHTAPEVPPVELRSVAKQQQQANSSNSTPEKRNGTTEKPVTPSTGKPLHRASSVSSSSPASSHSFKIREKMQQQVELKENSKDGSQPSWLQLAQQRREMREQRERMMLGHPTDSFVLEANNKPSRSSKVLDMVSNFQKLQMT